MDYSAANHALWNVIVQFGLLAGAILLANLLRQKLSFIRKSMLPVAVLAGFLLLFAKIIGLVNIDQPLMEMLVYHGIALGFIAMSLRVPAEKDKGRSDLTGLKSGAVIVSSYLVQGVTGLLITLMLSFTLMPNLFQASGLLLPMGYGQGPGQANNVGSSYEALGFAGGRSFGLAIAAAGYLVACVVGVVILNILSRRGKIGKTRSSDAELPAADFFQGKDEIPISDSIDKLSIQIAMVLLVYVLTYLCAWVVRVLLAHGKRTGIVLRQYQNNYLLNRLSGFFFDVMIVAGIASINPEDIRGLWLPFALLVIAGAVVTWIHLAFVCRAVYRDYYYEGLISMYGMLTGTISSGVLLLREIDPDLATPAANNLVVGSSFGIVLGAPVLILVGIAPRSPWLVVLLAAVYCAILYWVILKAHRKKKA